MGYIVPNRRYSHPIKVQDVRGKILHFIQIQSVKTCKISVVPIVRK